MNKATTIEEILSKLEDKKYSFLNEVEYAIKYKLEHTSISDCLSVVIRYSDGSTGATWYPKEVLDGYLPRFVAFIRKKKYNGNVVDSYLTDKVVDVVSNKFDSFYSNNSDLMAKPLLAALLSDAVFAQTLSTHIIETTNGALPAALKAKLSTLLLQKLDSVLGGNIINTTSHVVTTLTMKVVATAAAVPITNTLALLLMKHFAVLMKGVVAKVLASAAMKSMIVTTVKKIAAAKLIGATITLFASKVGITSTGAIIGWIIAPLILAFITHEIVTLPKKLAEKVSKEVRNELSGHFTNLNNDVVSSIFTSLLTTGAASLAGEIAQDPEMKELIKQLTSKIHS